MLEAPDLNYGQIFFMTLGFLPVLACFPCWLVAKFVYEPYLKELEKEEEIIKNEPIPFEYQFPIEKAENTKDKDSDFKNCIVLSNTPKGMDYMSYHKEEEGFECVVNKRTLQIIDSGVCLTDESTGVKGDTWLTLESLPGVIGEAMDLDKLVVWRRL